MSEIRNLTRNGETFYPLTHVDGVIGRNGVPLGEVNGIFDISEYNASGDPIVYPQYDTLALALGSVPQERRKGGMTIRYIDSVSGEYVQYRYLSTSIANMDFINTTNWQGVDSEPIAGSRDLVESGGVIKNSHVLPITGCSLVNETSNHVASNIRINQKNRTQFKVQPWYESITLVAPFSAIESGSKIDRVTIAFYNMSYGYLASIDMGWYFFNGQDVKISIPLKEDAYKNVAYFSIYFGSENETISPSEIDKSKIAFIVNDTNAYSIEDSISWQTVVGTVKLSGRGQNRPCIVKFKLSPGKLYNLHLSNTIWDRSGVSVSPFSIQHVIDGNSVVDYAVTTVNGAAKENYKVLAVEAEYYYVLLRGSNTVALEVEITELQQDLGYSVKEYNFTNDSEKLYGYRQLSNLRFYIVLSDEIAAGSVIKVLSEIENVDIAIESFSTWEDALNAANVASVEGGAWNVSEYLYQNTETKYATLAFKKKDGTAVTTSDVDNIKNNFRFELHKNDVLINKYGSVVNVKTSADTVTYGDGVVSDILAPTEDYLSFFQNSFERQIVLSNMAFKHITSPGRLRYTTMVRPRPLMLRVDNVPEGFNFGFKSNYTLKDAQSKNVSGVEDYGWDINGAVFRNNDASFLTISFKKSNGSSFTDEDIATINESGIVITAKYLISTDDKEDTDIVSLNDEEKTLRYLRNLKRPNISDNGAYTWGKIPFTLLHFSDIHADAVNLGRKMEYRQHYIDYIDESICSGDIIRNKFGDSYDFWTAANAQSILVSTGNHEYYNGEKSDYYTQITPKQVYDKFFAPYIADWGEVVFPENAAVEGYNYYYKDYADKKIRLIVLDNMANMSATRNNVQSTWLAGVLESARQLQYHVICVIHIGSTMITKFDNPFTSLSAFINTDSGANSQTYAEFYALRDAVETFIDNGGNFVAWITGHTHRDTIGILTNYSQCIIHVPTAAGGDTQRNVDGHVWWIIPQGDDCSRADNTKSQDCFNIYSVDTEKGMLRLFRVGNDLDRYGRHKGVLVYDYINKAVIYFD